MKRIAVYAGSFDPITNGHLYILNEALKDFDEIIMLVAVNPAKVALFPMEERVLFIKEAIKDFCNVSVYSYEGYTVDFARMHHARYLLRGLRGNKDLEYEKLLATQNKKLAPEIETIYYQANKVYQNISSSLIRKKIINGEDVSMFVPVCVADKLHKMRP